MDCRPLSTSPPQSGCSRMTPLRIAVELAQLSGGVEGLPVRDDRVSVEKRWIPTMSQAELFELYKDLHGQHEHVSSWSGFSRAWKCWQSVLGIRAPQVHSRCDDCARYSQFRRIQTSAADLEAVTKAYTSHIKQVYADRQILTSMENAVGCGARYADRGHGAASRCDNHRCNGQVQVPDTAPAARTPRSSLLCGVQPCVAKVTGGTGPLASL